MRIYGLILLGVVANQVLANDFDVVKQSVNKVFPNDVVESILPSPIEGIVEVFVKGGVIFYADKSGKYLFLRGILYDVANNESVTAKRFVQQQQKKYQALPFKDAIKIVHGNGKRSLAVFSDPDCPYCKSLEKELANLENITIHVFLYPLAIHPEARSKAEQIWCSDNPATTWRNYMLNGDLLEVKDACPTPVEHNIALGADLGIRGTPYIILSNGQSFSGKVSAEEINHALEK